MSEDKGAGPAAEQEVNIDELEIDIVILAKNPNTLNQAAVFLTRRGWPTQVTGNLSKAIEMISDSRPDFVLLSFNHPSPALARLPELIVQTFNLTCVGFAESTDISSTNRLNNAKMQYKINGTPSGPNFQRSIRRILAEKFNVKLDDKGAVAENGNADKKNVFRIRDGQNNNQENSSIIQRGAAQLEGKIGDLSLDATSANGPNVIYNKTTANKHNSLQEGAAGLGGSTVNSNGPSAGARRNRGETTGDEGEELSPEELAASAANAEDSSDPVETTDATGASSRKKAKAPKNKKRKRLKNLLGDDESKRTTGNMLFGESMGEIAEAEAAAANSAPETQHSSAGAQSHQQPEVDLADIIKKSLFGGNGLGEAANSGVYGLLETAVETGLAQVCASQSQPIPLEIATRIGVFPIDSEALPGYLVLAMAQPMDDENGKFLQECENSLQAAFKERGVPGKIESGFWLDIPQVPFASWVQNVGTFNFKTGHHGAEIGVVYFQSEKPLPKATLVRENGMYTVAIDDISTTQPVNFKAYLYLQKNDKLYLYLRNGRHLQPEQKRRLQARQINEIFMKSIDVENFRVFLATTFLLDSIKNLLEAA